MNSATDHPSQSHSTQEVDLLYVKVISVAKNLTTQRSLSNDYLRRLNVGKSALLGKQDSPKKRKYQTFLRDVLEKGGPPAVLVCSIALTQREIASFSSTEALVNEVDRNKDSPFVNNSALRNLAKVHGIPGSIEDLVAFIDQTESASLANEAPRTSPKAPDSSTDAHRPAHRVFENASTQGISKIFESSVCGSIRLRTFEDGFKAAVTMIFPILGGPVDCLMSLDICERDVARLAMTLFGAEVIWVEQVLHVVLASGFKMIVPNSEVTLKGVADETIINVFGPEMHNAINATLIRRRELKEGKRVTECVSMIITRNGAIISLCLGMEGGVEIQNKLYT